MTVVPSGPRSSAASRVEPAARPSLVDWALERLCARLADPSRPAGADADRGPLVLVSPAGRDASEILGEFLARHRGRLGGGSLAERAAVWHGADLAAALTRDLGGDHPLRLVRLLARQAVVLIDGGAPLGGLDGQHGFVHMLDACAASGTMVCISLADHPGGLAGLCPTLASRLCGGLVVRVPAEVSAPLMAAGTGGTITLRRVLRVVARHHDVDVATLVGPRRCRSIATARSVSLYLARLFTGKSLHAIGAECGGRDHTTVLHATRTVAARIATDPAFAADVGRLVEMLSAGRWRRLARRADADDDAQPAADRSRSGMGTGSRASRCRRVGAGRQSRNQRSA